MQIMNIGPYHLSNSCMLNPIGNGVASHPSSRAGARLGRDNGGGFWFPEIWIRTNRDLVDRSLEERSLEERSLEERPLEERSVEEESSEEELQKEKSSKNRQNISCYQAWQDRKAKSYPKKGLDRGTADVSQGHE